MVALTTTLCGTFRRRPQQLQRLFAELSGSYEVLSPISTDFLDQQAEFVRLPGEESEAVVTIERRHLEAIRGSDFVWLFCPDGYLGASATFEMGFAHSVGVPVFSDVAPSDPTLATAVRLVDGPASVHRHLQPDPGRGLAYLQRYYARVSKQRGWDEESARDTLLLLTEEIGELARAIRKTAGLSRHGQGRETEHPIGHELADVQLYLVHLANSLNVDLAAAITEKEAVNAARFAAKTSTSAA